MFKYTFIISVFLLSLTITANAGINWRSDLASAKAASSSSGKPLLIFFHASWCGPCHQMEKDTFEDKNVQGLLGRMVCVKLDIDQNTKEAITYQVNSIPRILVMTPGGRVLMDTIGYMEAPEFLKSIGDSLHIKEGIQAAAAILQEDKDLAAIKSAIDTKSYTAFKQKNPKSAMRGISLLVHALGVFDEAEVTPIISQISETGSDAIPALIQGMSSDTLAVRAGSYRAIRAILKTRNLTEPSAYDPWDKAAKRKAVIKQWTKWWKKQGR